MRLHSLTAIMIATTCLLTGCQTTNSPTRIASNLINQENIATTTDATYPAKKPQQVALYTHDAPSKPYRVIGLASVYNKNLFGITRQDETIKQRMQSLAASIGGDGLIDFIHQRDKVQASVIAFQKILL